MDIYEKTSNFYDCVDLFAYPGWLWQEGHGLDDAK